MQQRPASLDKSKNEDVRAGLVVWRSAGGDGYTRGTARYLQSLPVGPNHSNRMLTPGLLLQSPELPASLFGVGGKKERQYNEEERWRERQTLLMWVA